MGSSAGEFESSAQKLGQSIERPVVKTIDEVRRAVDSLVRNVAPAAAPPQPQAAAPDRTARPAASPRVDAADPPVEPPLHGTQPHGQGTVAAIDIMPSPERPLPGDPEGGLGNEGEDIVVGRTRGEQGPDGTYNGHITIAALFGMEIVGVDTTPGQSQAGPLDAIQQGVLDPICMASATNVCLAAVTADSTTTPTGSTNRFSTANAQLGGQGGISVGAAESNGNASDDTVCQTTTGNTTIADVNVGGQALADVANSSTESRACKGQAPTQTNSSMVIGLGGTSIPLPAAGCGTGEPDTLTGLPVLLPIVCNADETNTAQATAPFGVREALSVFALATGATSVAKTTAGASESRAQNPAPQCSDGRDNDGDGVIDANDPGCRTDPNNPATFNPADDDESNAATVATPPGAGPANPGAGGGGGGDLGGGGGDGGNGDGGNGDGGNGDGGDGGNGDGDGDGAGDGGRTDGPTGATAQGLPFTGTNAIVLTILGLLLVAAGVQLRRPAGLGRS